MTHRDVNSLQGSHSAALAALFNSPSIGVRERNMRLELRRGIAVVMLSFTTLIGPMAGCTEFPVGSRQPSVRLSPSLAPAAPATAAPTSNPTTSPSPAGSPTTFGSFVAYSGENPPTGRIGAAFVETAGHVFILGGTMDGASASKTIEQASLSPDGALGPFETSTTSLNTARIMPATAIARGFLYVLGGLPSISSSTALTSIERAPVLADGTVGGFTTLAATLSTGLAAGTPHVSANRLYLFGGGSHSSDSTTSVWVAAIDEDGGLGPFSPGPALKSARAGAGVVEASGSLYLIGGYTKYEEHKSIERAAVGPDGTVGDFSQASSSLVAGRHFFSLFLLGSNLYVMGGLGSAPFKSVERARFDAAGLLSAFATTSIELTGARAGGGVAPAGKWLYSIGGFGGSGSPVGLTSIDRATLQ